MKRCTKCKKEKDEGDFYNDKKAKDVKTHHCKSCMDVVTSRTYRRHHPRPDWSASSGKKKCRKCLKEKPFNEFNAHSGTKDKLRNECKECQADHAKKHYAGIAVGERKKRKVHYQNNKDLFKGYGLKAKYGLSFEEYQKMNERQNGVCAICGLKQCQALAVDHEHGTSKVRGLLCSQCNAGIGNFKDSIDMLQKAIKYLNQ